MDYICEHCNSVIGQYVEGELQPKCPDHPDGVVMLVGE